MKEILMALKTKILHFLAVSMAFLIPIKPLMILVGLFILADTCTGLYKAKKIGEKITSRRLSDVISKMVLYQAAIILLYAVELYILEDFIKYFIGIHLFATKIGAVFLISVEYYSIDEKITILTGKSTWDRFKKLLRRAKEVKDEIQDFKEDEPTV